MSENFDIQITIERVNLLARLVTAAHDHLNDGDHELAVLWIAEITKQPVNRNRMCPFFDKIRG